MRALPANDTPYLYHAAPLHYLPHIVASGALCAKSVTAGSAIRPRASACRRDRMLGLSDYVHFYTKPHSPLLADKVRKGYSHALLIFEAEPLLSQPGTGVMLYNTKSWRHRDDFQPITSPAEIARILAEHATGLHPSLEVLVKYAAGLERLREIAFIGDADRGMAFDTFGKLGLRCTACLTVAPELFPTAGESGSTSQLIVDYFRNCRRAGALLPPPNLAFD